MTRTAVVTGGTAGVGRATVRELAAADDDVAALARGQAGLEAAAADVKAAGQRALPVVRDVANSDAVEQAAQHVEEGLGEIDLWVNVAFVGSLAFFWDTTVEEFRRITEVTYFGQVHGTRAALARMRPRDRGVVVNVGSAMAYRSIPLQSAYCAAKHAIKGFTESVITELAHERSGVRVCMVQLPGLNTPQFTWNLERVEAHPRPVAPVWQPEVAARAIRFLAEHPRRTMWVRLATVYTILGERLAPKIVDLYLGRYGVAGQQTRADLPRRGSNVDEPRRRRGRSGGTRPVRRRGLVEGPADLGLGAPPRTGRRRRGQGGLRRARRRPRSRSTGWAGSGMTGRSPRSDGVLARTSSTAARWSCDRRPWSPGWTGEPRAPGWSPSSECSARGTSCKDWRVWRCRVGS